MLKQARKKRKEWLNIEEWFNAQSEGLPSKSLSESRTMLISKY